MPRAYYENFDIVITRAENNIYKADVMNALGGDQSVTFDLSEAPEEVIAQVTRNFKLAANPNVTAQTNNGNGTKPKSMEQYLSDSLLTSKMQSTLSRTRELAQKRNAFVRLRLNLTAVPELVGLPWEMLSYNHNALALNIRTSVVRYQSVENPPELNLVVREKPLRMLVVISNPSVPAAPALDVEEEWKRINAALQPLINQKLLELERLPKATLNELDDRLVNPHLPPVHVFHYIGHGTFDQATGKGQLVFEVAPDDVMEEDSQGINLVDGERLGQTLANCNSLRLVSLNACEGATSSISDSFSGVAQNVMLTGEAPIVIAMRQEISDDIAIAFSQTFYQWLLVNNVSVDTAMTRARLRMRDAEQKRIGDESATEWATPILFMRSRDGYLWDYSKEDSIVVPDTFSEDIEASMVTHYQTVLNALTKGKLVPFLGLGVNLLDRPEVENWTPENGTLPSYRELVGYLVSRTQHPNPFIPALADISQYALLQYRKDEQKGEGTFFSDLVSIFNLAQEPTALHRFWAKLAKHNHRITETAFSTKQDFNRRFLILSSTYDNLLERAFCNEVDQFHVLSYVAHGDNQGKFRHTVYAKGTEGIVAPSSSDIVQTANNYGQLNDQLPVILKIPGTVGDTGGPRIAITEDQYLDFFSKRELAGIIPGVLLTKLRSSNHLFLGYNVREWCVRALLYRIWEDTIPPMTSWTVQAQATQVETNYWEACGVRSIGGALKQYLNGLRSCCRELLKDVDF
jgi:CHAT domain-containing protein/SIR2-like protein